MPSSATSPFLGLYTVIYPAPDVARARAWYAHILGQDPYFDEPFYVGFNVGGYELGLDPDAPAHPAGSGGEVAYWGTADIHASLRHLLDAGARLRSDVQSVGEGIEVATVWDPFGNILGLIKNPHFRR